MGGSGVGGRGWGRGGSLRQEGAGGSGDRCWPRAQGTRGGLAAPTMVGTVPAWPWHVVGRGAFPPLACSKGPNSNVVTSRPPATLPKPACLPASPNHTCPGTSNHVQRRRTRCLRSRARAFRSALESDSPKCRGANARPAVACGVGRGGAWGSVLATPPPGGQCDVWFGSL